MSNFKSNNFLISLLNMINLYVYNLMVLFQLKYIKIFNKVILPVKYHWNLHSIIPLLKIKHVILFIK